MPPNLEDNLSKSDNNITTHDIPNELGTPSTSSSASASDGASASGSTGPDNSLPSLHEYEEINLPDLDLPDLEGDLDLEYLNRFQIPLEQNLRELLVQVTNSDDLQSITQLKLKVIAREVPLQQLSIHTPFLRELILDGSIVSTLRDLGCGLKNLKILRVNRCMLTCIDSVFGFEMLEELYAADNDIKDLLPCAFLTNLKILDVRRNALKKTNTLGFLTLCPNLKDLYLEGNFESQVFPKYRETIKSMIPSLVALDGITFSEVLETSISEEETMEFLQSESEDVASENVSTSRIRSGTPRTRRTSKISSGFVVQFPPRVFVNSPLFVTNNRIRGENQPTTSEDVNIENIENEK